MIRIVALRKLRLTSANRPPHRDTIEALKKDMPKYGQRRPIEINSEGDVVHGAQRFRAAEEMGWDGIVVTDF